MLDVIVTCAKLASMLEQAPASTVTLTLECVSPRARVHAAGRTGRRRGPGARAHAWISALAATLLTLGPGCSLLLDFDLPPPDAKAVDATAVDAAPVDATPVDADAAPPPDAPGVDAAPGPPDAG